MVTAEIAFNKHVYIDRLKSAGVDEPRARAHAEALDQAFCQPLATKHDLVATKHDLRDAFVRLDHKIELAVLDLKIWTGECAIFLFIALATIKFYG